MKKFVILTLLLTCVNIMQAQDVVKPVVNVDEFTYSSEFSEAEAENVRSNVISSLQATNRLHVVDLHNQRAIDRETNRRRDEAAMNDNRDVAEMTQLNANYILKGALKSIQTTSETSTSIVDGKPYTIWRSVFRYSLMLINPATGATDKSYEYESRESSREGASKARLGAIDGSRSNMKAFIEDAFAVKGKILQIESGDEKKAKTVYINLGSIHGISKGQKFIVYAVIDIAGAKSEKEIGDLTAQEILGDNRTLCKVSNGGSEILKYMNQNVELTIKSRDKKGLLKSIGNLM